MLGANLMNTLIVTKKVIENALLANRVYGSFVTPHWRIEQV
jgi:hypothetical protein